MSYFRALLARLGAPAGPAPLARPAAQLGAAGAPPLEASAAPPGDGAPRASSDVPPATLPPASAPLALSATRATGPAAPASPAAPLPRIPPDARAPAAAPVPRPAPPAPAPASAPEPEPIEAVRVERETTREIVRERRVEERVPVVIERTRELVQPLVRARALPPPMSRAPAAPARVPAPLASPAEAQRALAEPAAPPAVHVTIGRVVVRADPPRARPARAPAQTRPHRELGDYLKEREGERR